MSGPSWGDGRRAWQRLSGWQRPVHGEATTDETRDLWGIRALDALADIRLVRGLLDQAELGAVRRARDCNKSWAEIASTLGMTRQAAWDRYRKDGELLDAPE